MDANTKTDSLLHHRCNGLARRTPVSYSGARRDSGAVPGPAKILGAVGLLPFVGLACALWLAPPARLDALAGALTSYAAVILAFMGAIYWGLAMGRECRRRPYWYTLGVLPAITGWCATMLSPATGLTVMAVAFAGVFALDLMAIEAGLAPRWYARLRQPLTAIVVASLTLGATAIWVFAQ